MAHKHQLKIIGVTTCYLQMRCSECKAAFAFDKFMVRLAVQGHIDDPHFYKRRWH